MNLTDIALDLIKNYESESSAELALLRVEEEAGQLHVKRAEQSQEGQSQKISGGVFIIHRFKT